MYQSLDTFAYQEIRVVLHNIASTSKRNYSQNKRCYNLLTKRDIRNNYIKQDRTLNTKITERVN